MPKVTQIKSAELNSTAMEASSQDFWSSLPTETYKVFGKAFSEESLSRMIDGTISISGDQPTITAKFLALQKLAVEEIARKQAAQEDVRDARYALGFAENELGNIDPFQSVWFQLIHNRSPAKPELSALNNLAWALKRQGNYPAAEALFRALTPTLQSDRFSRNSPQALGCYRALIDIIAAQGRMTEAQDICTEAEELVQSIDDAELKRDEHEALEEVRKRLGSE